MNNAFISINFKMTSENLSMEVQADKGLFGIQISNGGRVVILRWHNVEERG